MRGNALLLSQDLLVERFYSPQARREGKLLLNTVPTRLSHLSPQLFISRESHNGVREPENISLGNDKTRLPIDHKFSSAGDIGGDNGEAHRHGF
jgi:hypothetical protein